MSDTKNGTKTDAATFTVVTGNPEPQPYRPTASTDKVRETIISSLSEIVSQAAYQAGTFVSLASLYDKDKGTAIRYGHLVDAAECLEIAQVHMDRLKNEVAYHLRTEDERNVGPDPGFCGF